MSENQDKVKPTIESILLQRVAELDNLLSRMHNRLGQMEKEKGYIKQELRCCLICNLCNEVRPSYGYGNSSSVTTYDCKYFGHNVDQLGICNQFQAIPKDDE